VTGRRRRWSGAVAAALLAGCAVPPPAAPETPPEIATATGILSREGPGPGANGIESLQWSVTDDEALIEAALRRHAMADLELGLDRERLRREGLRVEAVAEKELAEFLADLGGTTVALQVWHGQAPDWHEIARTRIDVPTVVLADGRPARLDRGYLRLLLRGWTIPLELGAVVEVQVEPRWAGDASTQSVLPGAPPRRGGVRGFRDGSFRIELPREACLVIVAAPPSAPAPPSGPRPATQGGAVRTGGPGPPAELPLTLGEALLREPGMPPRRRMVVVRPRLPDILFGDDLRPVSP